MSHNTDVLSIRRDTLQELYNAVLAGDEEGMAIHAEPVQASRMILELPASSQLRLESIPLPKHPLLTIAIDQAVRDLPINEGEDLIEAIQAYADIHARVAIMQFAQASAALEQDPAAWLIDWPDFPKLGHYFSDDPNDCARSRPLYTHADPSEVAKLRAELAKAQRNEHNSEVAYRAAIERQDELRADRDAATQRADAAERKLSEAVGLLTKALAGCDEATETFEDESNGPGQWRCHACWSDCSAGWHHGKIVSGSHTQISHEPDCWAESARALLSARAEPASSWVKCSDRLPVEDSETQVLILLADGRMTTAVIEYPFSNPDSYIWSGVGELELDDDKVTHWMPLPDAPAKGGEVKA